SLGHRQQTLAGQEGTAVGESLLCEQVARQLQDNIVLLNRVRSLEDERRQLVDGAPCPLCGAVEHPYAAGNIPQLDEAQQELEQALGRAKQVREQLSQIKQDLVAVGKDLQQSGLEQNELREQQSRDETFCANAFVELGVNAAGSVWSEVIRQESDSCREELAGRRGIILAAERKEHEERGAQALLARLKDELSEHDRSRLAARLKLENVLSERVRLEVELSALHNDLEKVLAEVESAVARFGCPELTPDKADELLATLIVRRTAYVERQQDRERLEKARADAAAERDKLRALLAESEKTLFDKEQQLRERSAQRETLVEQRLEQYGERSPDVEEKRLSDALKQAGDLRETAVQEQHRLQGELGGLKGEIERLTLSVSRRGEQLSELEAAIRQRLDEAGFADEAAFLQACLPQERFDALTQMADSLSKDETALEARHLDRTEGLAGELNKNLTDKPLDQLLEENAAVTGQLSELQKGVGALEQKLQQHADQQQRFQMRLKAIDLQRLECDRWERLHSLIGSGDGKKFRNFAQGLTFELMVAHANRQLRKMSDRYILVRDNSEPLELNVIDNYQAGEIRSTKNLSGGESFIASLALSLGLSSMASRNVRVDSLFLDEGFGTLDEDALETALETLSGLQQDGKLIGIISHVPALKERIGTQIQLEAGNSGRSSLSGPGCRRIS
ncbi:MAG: SbcC/MukB-like Walker B domain-containing protein, partial [Pelobacteraceae bacterium]